MSTAVFFPGQGAQYTGMGQAVYQASQGAKRIFSLASDIAGQSIEKLCFEGSKEQLSRTVNSQIAIFTCSLAVLEALKEQNISPDAYAGFSLGEYTALTASGMVSFEDGIRLVIRRGELMQQAADQTDGCMAAVLGLRDAAVEEICARVQGVVLPVNYNCKGQLVIAGERQAVQAAADACRQAGAKRVMPLAVSGAFHTPLMAQAAAQLRAFAQDLTFHEPSVPVYTNVTAGILSAQDLPAHLERHMVSPVRWQELVLNMMRDGFCNALEAGPGKTLTGFARRISKDLSCRPVETV